MGPLFRHGTATANYNDASSQPDQGRVHKAGLMGKAIILRNGQRRLVLDSQESKSRIPGVLPFWNGWAAQ